MKCPNCQSVIETNWLVCPSCGFDLFPLESAEPPHVSLGWGNENKTISTYQSQILPNPVMERKRGGCLTTWLLLVIVSNSVSGLYNLILLSDNSQMGIIIGFSVLVAFGSIIFAIGMLNWKKWGVIGLGVSIVVGNLTAVGLGVASGFVTLIIQLGLLIGLTNKTYHLFE